jgi:hypothetical protein
MSKKVKRTISVIIAAIMLLSTMSVLAFADLPTYPEATSKETVPHEHVAAYNADGTVKETLAEYVQPTCVKEGSKEYFVKCTICGKEIPGTRRKVTVDVLESHHQAGPVSIEKIKQPTCDAEGSYYEVVRCVLCNEVLSKTLVKVSKTNAHVPDLPVKENVVPATCADEGSYKSVTYCKVCGLELASVLKVIPKLNYHMSPEAYYAANPSIHNEKGGPYVNGKTRTCADGAEECVICGAELKPAIPHVWDAGTVAVKATPTTQGLIVYKCLVKGCNAHYDVTTPVTNNPSKVGDVDGDGKVTTADARLILRYAVGLGSYDKVITALTEKFADMDGNAKIEPADARMALRAAVGLPN